MNTIVSKISIDLQKPASVPVVHAVQGERESRVVELTLMADGTPWMLPSGAILTVRYGRSLLSGGYYDTLPDGTPACSYNGNVITMTLAPQMMAQAGAVLTQIEILHEDQMAATFSFRLMVEVNPAVGIVQPENYVNWLQWLQKQLALYTEEIINNGDFMGPAGPAGEAGAPATLVSSNVAYQGGNSGTQIPTGTWSSTVPVVAQGKYLWTRITNTFNSGNPVVSYSVSRMGLDGSGSVSSVANVSPDENGNVPLTAAQIGALPNTGGTMQGPIDMNGKKITGLNHPATDTEPATKDYTLELTRNAAPRNLLDNSDFRNPVNQRNEVLYKGAGYGIDRWSCSSSNWNVSVEDGYIRYYSDNPNKTTGMLQQRIAITPANRGKTITLAARVKGDYVRLNINDNATGSYYKNADTWTVLRKTATVPTTGDTFFVALQNQKGADVEGFMCEWMALYEGEYTAETLPEYRPKGYENELAICRQYDPVTGEYLGMRNFGWGRNFLDNSDFKHLVAQAGILGTHGTQAYLADRWKTAGYGVIYNESTNTLTFSADGVSMIRQMIAGNVSGKTVTLALKAGGVTGAPKLSESGAQSGHADVRIQNGITIHTFVAGDNTEVILWSNDGATLSIEWIALYEGTYTADTLPAYRPKGYGQELLECQRYYQICSANNIAARDMRPTMRLDSPTIAAVTDGYSYCADL